MDGYYNISMEWNGIKNGDKDVTNSKDRKNIKR
jgi:hypothetical protein